MRVLIQKTTFSLNLEIQTDILERAFILTFESLEEMLTYIIVKQIRMNLKP